MIQTAKNSFNRLDLYLHKKGYKGWDLFDGLNSKIFRASPLYKYPLLRLAWIQLFKRSPINFRKIAMVPEGFNAKGMALFASGLIWLNRTEEAEALLDKLRLVSCRGYAGNSWGYNFDWQARAFYVPEGKPNMVTSVFVANAFLDFYESTQNQEALETACKTGSFIIKHLILFENTKQLCFGYIPDEDARVHNVNMLGACLLGRLFSHTGNYEYLRKSQKAMAYSMAALNQDYAWSYGEIHHHRFIDNFHTGFNLVALKNWMAYTGELLWEEDLNNAFAYYLDTFWMEDGRPKYYNDSLYPIDIHCCAQGIITCLELKDHHKDSLQKTDIIMKWAIENMRSRKGFFYYQKTKFFMNKIPYIRWSQAWMFYALSFYLSRTQKGLSQKEAYEQN